MHHFRFLQLASLTSLNILYFNYKTSATKTGGYKKPAKKQTIDGEMGSRKKYPGYIKKFGLQRGCNNCLWMSEKNKAKKLEKKTSKKTPVECE